MHPKMFFDVKALSLLAIWWFTTKKFTGKTIQYVKALNVGKNTAKRAQIQMSIE